MSPLRKSQVTHSSIRPVLTAARRWNRTLMRQRGAAMGAEFKGKGGVWFIISCSLYVTEVLRSVHVALGPMMNLMRAPAAGRNWEG